MFVGFGEAIHFLRGHIEGGVFHGKRPEDAFCEERAEAFAGDAFDECAEDVAVDPVAELVAGLMLERQFAGSGEKIIQARPAPQVGALVELMQRIVAIEVIDESAGVGEQMLDGDGAF